jgi:hypothetical protein
MEIDPSIVAMCRTMLVIFATRLHALASRWVSELSSFVNIWPITATCIYDHYLPSTNNVTKSVLQICCITCSYIIRLRVPSINKTRVRRSCIMDRYIF